MIRPLYHHRNYILRTALADLRNRYAGSAMGIIWNVLQPLALILMFSIVFTGIMDRGDTAVQELPGGFAVFLCAALLPWLGLSECIIRGTNALTANANYLKKMPIPEHVFVAKAATTSAIGLAISFSLLMLISVLLGMPIRATWLLLPIPLVLLIVLGFGFAMALSAINALIRDTQQVMQIVMRIGFWSYPIVYPIEIVPDWFRSILPWNPVYAFLHSTRDLYLWGQMPEPKMWAMMLAWCLVSLVVGMAVLRRLRTEIRDVI